MAERVAFLQPSLPGRMPGRRSPSSIGAGSVGRVRRCTAAWRGLAATQQRYFTGSGGLAATVERIPGVILTADRIQGRGICLEPASAALEGCRLPEGFSRGTLAAILKRGSNFTRRYALSGMAKRVYSLLGRIASSGGRKLSGGVAFCSQKVFSLRLDSRN